MVSGDCLRMEHPNRLRKGNFGSDEHIVRVQRRRSGWSPSIGSQLVKDQMTLHAALTVALKAAQQAGIEFVGIYDERGNCVESCVVHEWATIISQTRRMNGMN